VDGLLDARARQSLATRPLSGSALHSVFVGCWVALVCKSVSLAVEVGRGRCLSVCQSVSHAGKGVWRNSHRKLSGGREWRSDSGRRMYKAAALPSIPAAMHSAWLHGVAEMPMTGRRRRPCSASFSRSIRVAVAPPTRAVLHYKPCKLNSVCDTLSGVSDKNGSM
jgi:hypothetical protein